jgi:DNA polymerase III delta prime subunit
MWQDIRENRQYERTDMNIKEAKQEIKNTIRCYLQKDDTGEYAIPVPRQRPVLLIGPPGIGKTAIMEQVAQELGINLVSYTITHHTRQSAIGLPFIAKHEYGGKEYSVTEYTMSEIIASVYDQIESSGIPEGILFLDEINCVSETLAPTMLQFLQYKTFGTHRVPDGFLIVTAGNPPQYNQSVRDFDIVTLDRVKRIDIEENFEAWKEYAYKEGIHGSIMSYLSIRKEHFYSIRTEAEAKYFVTARGWEDLSRIIAVCENLSIPVTEKLCVQYLQDPEIADSFATYYELWNKYRNVYRIPDILAGRSLDGAQAEKHMAKLSAAPFDEKLSLLGLLIDSLGQEFHQYATDEAVQECLYEHLKKAGDAAENIGAEKQALGRELQKGLEAKLLDRENERVLRKAVAAMGEAEHLAKTGEAGAGGTGMKDVKKWFADRETKRAADAAKAGEHLTNAFRFLSKTFGDGQEIVIFLSELAEGYYSLKYVSECGNDAYYRYNKLLLLKDRKKDLQEEIRGAVDGTPGMIRL